MTKGMTDGYVVKLNDTYITKYDPDTGYQEFGTREQALVFKDYRDAVDALVDVVWGGEDERPAIVDVVREDVEE